MDEDYLIGYEAKCPKCGRMMIEPLERMPRLQDGVIVVKCRFTGRFTSGRTPT
jgi:hypothetical protein